MDSSASEDESAPSEELIIELQISGPVEKLVLTECDMYGGCQRSKQHVWVTVSAVGGRQAAMVDAVLMKVSMGGRNPR